MRRALRTMVADLFADVHECAHSTDALAAYAEHRPGWAVLDLGTIGEGAIVATRQITRAYPDAKVVLVGIYDDVRDAARLAGAVAYVLTENMVDLRTVLTGDGRLRNDGSA